MEKGEWERAGEEKEEGEGKKRGGQTSPTSRVLERTLAAQLEEREWGRGKTLPPWAQAGLAHELSLAARQEAREERAQLKGRLDLAAVESNPSMDSSTGTAGASERGSRRQQRQQRRKAEIAAFQRHFRFRSTPFTQDELDTAVCQDLANRGNMFGVRSLVSLIYKASANAPPAAGPSAPKSPHLTRSGEKIVFDSTAPRPVLTNPARQKLFSKATVEENTLFNAGISLSAPADKPPRKAPPGTTRVSFASNYSTEYYDPLNPDLRTKHDRFFAPVPKANPLN